MVSGGEKARGDGTLVRLRDTGSVPRTLRLGILHLAPAVGGLGANRSLVEMATAVAADHGADWVLSGELVISGYAFEPIIGTNWIEERPARWLTRYASLCRELEVAAFVSHPERADGRMYNTAFVIDRAGHIVGAHRKLSPTPGSEDWSSAGTDIGAIDVDGVRVGLLVCADAYSSDPARRLRAAGAELVVSLAAWWPGPYGPSGEWEARTLDTGMPMIVCNRTGREEIGDLAEAVSTVVADGRRLLELSSPTSTVFTVDLTIAENGRAVAARLSGSAAVDEGA
jgi:N-carbamoylputrescine amidase